MRHLHSFLHTFLYFPNFLMLMGTLRHVPTGPLASKDPTQWVGLWAPSWKWFFQAKLWCSNRGVPATPKFCQVLPLASSVSSKTPVNTLIHPSGPEHWGLLSLVTEPFSSFLISLTQCPSQCPPTGPAPEPNRPSYQILTFWLLNMKTTFCLEPYE